MRASVRSRLSPWLVLGVLALPGCGGSAGSVHLAPGEDSFGQGRQLYEIHNYSEAAQALKQYLDASPAGTHAEEASFLLGMSYAQSNQCPLAEVELRHFVDQYPGSAHLPEVEYRLGVCFWADALPAPYDQEKTIYARDQLNRVVVLYPDSPFAESAKKLMLEVRDRLAEKAVLNARLYLRLHQPASTVFYAQRVLQDYPDSRWAAEALYLQGEGLFEQNQLQSAREAWAQLVREKPGTEWAGKARDRLSSTGSSHP